MSVAGDTQEARDLLAALANFVKPFVYEYMQSDTIRNVARQNESSPEEPVEKQLVSHLKAYIAKTVDDCRAVAPPPMSSSSAHLSTVARSTALVPGASVIAPYTINSYDMNRLRSIFLDQLHSAVSKMPTRLLVFNVDGSSIRLVSGHEILHILTDQLWGLLQDHFSGKIFSSSAGFSWLEWQLDKLISKHCRYAIISHTWNKELHGELSYHDWSTRMQHPTAFAKIRNFCRVSAQEHNCYLAWIDTCCINKESSAELDEAIRSMYKWYSQAAVCIIYLAETKTVADVANDSWFTRGWTLQELVAPRNKVCVYNKHWEALECDEITVLGSAAGISVKEMEYFRKGDQEKIPISRRLQMACDRRVTREEDTAYSLMGILNVSISIAYGEGSRRAFSRLMNEVINTRRDILDIFNHGYDYHSRGAVPQSIELYRFRSMLFDTSNPPSIIPSEPLLLTHLGLRMNLLLVPGIRDSYKQLETQPKGELYGHLEDIRLLDQETYVPNIPRHAIRLFGIINFRSMNGTVKIMKPSLAVPLISSSDEQIGNLKTVEVRLSDYIIAGPPTFTIQSMKDSNETDCEITIPTSDLELIGLQLITAYL